MGHGSITFTWREETREQQLGEDAGDEVQAPVVQHHLPMDQDDAVHSNLPRQRTAG